MLNDRFSKKDFESLQYSLDENVGRFVNDALEEKLSQPWVGEPDVQSIEGKGYHLLVWRNPELGCLNGYVGVNINHPCYGLHYDDSKLYDIHVHGGLNFSGKHHMFKNKYWYFGFDTGHAWDIVPSIQKLMKEIKGMPSMERLESSMGMKSTYKDINYVSKEVNALHEQLKTIKDNKPDYKPNHKRIYRRMHKVRMNLMAQRRFMESWV